MLKFVNNLIFGQPQEEEILYIIPPMKKVPRRSKEPKAITNDVDFKESMNLNEKHAKKMMKESKKSKKSSILSSRSCSFGLSSSFLFTRI